MISPNELRDVWLLTRPVTSDQAVSRWLQIERGLDPQLIADHELARVLPVHQALPRWAGFERDGQWQSWPRKGYRIVVPLYDCRGQLRSVRFRAPRPGAKARPATGTTGIGLVMADSIAQSVLARGEAPQHLQGDELSIVIAEGETDFWSWATEPARRGLGDSARTFPAVFGVVSGSFDGSIAARLPERSRIISALDHDTGGDRIHAAIVRKLVAAGRNYNLTRWMDDRAEEA